mmetsp:Transcript_16527/g.42337  ORF Transcript_16527/g.42337 Transcript_16527/m.42337 type:complete len:454 (+) Transcript_16527:479-1840(+)
MALACAGTRRTLGHNPQGGPPIDWGCRQQDGRAGASAGLQKALDQVGHVHGHLLDRRVVELLDLAERPHVLAGEEVDRNTLATEAATAADAVDVVLPVRRQVIVDDQRHLLHVDAAREHVGRDEDPTAARAELAHDHLTLLLVEVSVDGGAGEVARMHLLRQPLHLPAGVDEDHRLGDGQRLVQVAQRVELPLLTIDHDVELLDAVQRELVTLDQDADRVAHELASELEHVGGHRRREETDVHRRRQLLEDVVDLVLEAAREHLVRLVQHKVVQVVDRHGAAVDHVEHTAGSANDELHTGAQLVHVLADVGATDARHGGDAQVVAERNDDLDNLRGELARRREDKRLAIAVAQVDVLQQADAESGGLASARLRLRDGVAHHQQRLDRTLLDGRRLLETVRVDASEQVLLEVHVVEALNDFIVVGLDDVSSLSELSDFLFVLPRHIVVGAVFFL